MDLTHSKTMESTASEVYNIPDSKSTDLIQPPRDGPVGPPSDVLAKGESRKNLIPGTLSVQTAASDGWVLYANLSVPGPEFRVYTRRWIVLAIFCLYSASNSMQWIQYSIIANVVQKWVKRIANWWGWRISGYLWAGGRDQSHTKAPNVILDQLRAWHTNNKKHKSVARMGNCGNKQ